MIRKSSLTLSILALFLPSCDRARGDRETTPAPSGGLPPYEVCAESYQPALVPEKVHEFKGLSLEVPGQAGDSESTTLAHPGHFPMLCVQSYQSAPVPEGGCEPETPEQAGDNGRTAPASPQSPSLHEVRSATHQPVPGREERQEMTITSPEVPEQAESEETKQATADCVESEKPKPVAILISDYFGLEKTATRRAEAKQAFALIGPDEVGGDYYFSHKPSLQKVLIKKGQDVEIALRNAFKRLNR